MTDTLRIGVLALQWLRHVGHWLRRFPVPGTDYHMWISHVGEPGPFRCWCGQMHSDGVSRTWDEEMRLLQERGR